MDQSNDPSTGHIAVIMLSAWFGTFLRYQQWMDEKGKLVWWRILFDIPGSCAFGMMALGLDAYIGHGAVSVYISGGLAGFMGMVGPAFIKALVEKFTGAKK